MFNLSNFDLDIDDDFSSNIFSNAVNSETKKVQVFEDIKFSNQSTPGYETNVSRNKHLREHTNSEDSICSNDLFISSMKESRENILKRPCEQYEKPQKKRPSHKGLLQRKFPGPAGLLPDRPFKDISSESILMEELKDEKEDEEDVEKPMLYSQHSGLVFQESSYQKLVTDFNLNESKNPLNRYTVEWLKKTALSKGLQGRKIPFLGLIVHSVSHTMPDPIVVLRDPTGEIHGSLHREVWADMSGKLKVGIALALRQVGVLITGVVRRQIYLNITMNNILALYSPSENENQVEITMVNKISKSDLERSFEKWLPPPSRNLSAKAAPCSPIFATVNDAKPSSRKREEMVDSRKRLLENPAGRTKAKAEAERVRKTEEVLTDLGIVLSDCDFNEEMGAESACAGGTLQGSVGTSSRRGNASGQALSQAESLIFEEVLSGIDLDEFEL